MPMKKGYGKKTISANMSREMKSGRPKKQAMAMSMSSARKSMKAAGKSSKKGKK